MNDKKSYQRSRPDTAGFTLIEIMVVVTILGLLAALATLSIPDILHSQKVKAAKQNIIRLQNAVDMYYVEIGKYPQNLKDLAVKSEGGIKFIKRMPKDPWNSDFVYKLPGLHGEDYSIVSYGADGTEGGTERNEDITSWGLEEGED